MEEFYNLLSNYYEISKALHIIFVICWIASIMYLLRIFVYHSKVSIGSESDLIFRTMESRSIKIIMNPSIVMTYFTGIFNAYIYGFAALGIWFLIKLCAVLVITVIHLYALFWKKNFDLGRNDKTTKFFRIVNEVPTIMMLLAVFMVILKPFE